MVKNFTTSVKISYFTISIYEGDNRRIKDR